MNPCVFATPRDGDEWHIQHKHQVAKAKDNDPKVILIGGSFIHLIQYYPIWVTKFEPMNSFNFGIPGDQTQHVLWRVQNGILDHIKPEVCILQVVDKSSNAWRGLLAIVNEIRSKLPDCYIIIIIILVYDCCSINDLATFEAVREAVKSMVKVELFIPVWPQPDSTLSQEDEVDYFNLYFGSGFRKIFNPIFKRLTTILNK